MALHTQTTNTYNYRHKYNRRWHRVYTESTSVTRILVLSVYVEAAEVTVNVFLVGGVERASSNKIQYYGFNRSRNINSTP